MNLNQIAANPRARENNSRKAIERECYGSAKISHDVSNPKEVAMGAGVKAAEPSPQHRDGRAEFVGDGRKAVAPLPLEPFQRRGHLIEVFK